VEDHDRVQDQVQEQGTFCSGKAIFGWCFGLKKKKKMYILLTGFWKSFFGHFVHKIGNFLLHFMFGNAFLDILKNRGKSYLYFCCHGLS
jgi:hypothetical protein